MRTNGLREIGFVSPEKKRTAHHPRQPSATVRTHRRDMVGGMPLASDAGSALAPLRPIFRAVVTTVVPEASSLDGQGWRDLESIAEALLRDRPAALKRQLRLFLRLIQWLPVVRYGRPFTSLRSTARTRVLAHLQNDPIQKIRVGFWGLRTIVLAGYYGRPEAARALGYSATPQGWEAVR
jgi:hypothetical protein